MSDWGFNLDGLRFRVLFLDLVVLLAVSLPTVTALPPCLIQNIDYTFPSSIMVGDHITVNTRLQATCVQWPPYAVQYSIRVDLSDDALGIIHSTTTYQVPYPQTYIDTVFTNTATAPATPGTWLLRVELYLWGGSGQLLVHTADLAKLQVGNRDSTTTP